ncbi:MAG: SUMF1/EgtB/PvdO family nonheme iron enzyme [Anaerolineales bacterium]|nr:SUMF1/EgtB/PvdO family nonheme iron enzyme [Anaerolineales bacterium]
MAVLFLTSPVLAQIITGEYNTPAAKQRCGVLCEAARRVVRGGSWNNNQNNARAAYRNNNNPNNRNNNNGFRVCRPTPPFIPTATVVSTGASRPLLAEAKASGSAG